MKDVSMDNWSKQKLVQEGWQDGGWALDSSLVVSCKF